MENSAHSSVELSELTLHLYIPPVISSGDSKASVVERAPQISL